MFQLMDKKILTFLLLDNCTHFLFFSLADLLDSQAASLAFDLKCTSRLASYQLAKNKINEQLLSVTFMPSVHAPVNCDVDTYNCTKKYQHTVFDLIRAHALISENVRIIYAMKLWHG